MSRTSENCDPAPPVPGAQPTAKVAPRVLKACHSALFPGALLRCSDAELTGSSSLDVVIVFQDGTTATATYRNQDPGPQLTVDPHQSAAGERRDGTTWSLHHAAPSVLRIRHLEEHRPPLSGSPTSAPSPPERSKPLGPQPGHA